MTKSKYARPAIKRPSPLRDAVVNALKTHGPMTLHEITEVLLDFDFITVSRVISANRAKWPGAFFRVSGYKPAVEVGSKCKHQLRVYAAMPGKDAPPPEIDRVENRRRTLERYKQNHAARVKISKAKYAAKIRVAKREFNPWQGLGQR